MKELEKLQSATSTRLMTVEEGFSVLPHHHHHLLSLESRAPSGHDDLAP